MHEAEDRSQRAANDDRPQPENHGDAEVAKPHPPTATSLSDYLANGDVAHADAPPREGGEHPLPADAEEIALDMASREALRLRLDTGESGNGDDDGDEYRGVPPRCYCARMHRPGVSDY